VADSIARCSKNKESACGYHALDTSAIRGQSCIVYLKRRYRRSFTFGSKIKFDRLPGEMLPGTDAEDGRGRDPEAVLGTCVADIGHPCMGVFQFEDAPCEWTSNDEVHTTADGDAGAVVGNLD
jgi:hypothetical protein